VVQSRDSRCPTWTSCGGRLLRQRARAGLRGVTVRLVEERHERVQMASSSSVAMNPAPQLFSRCENQSAHATGTAGSMCERMACV